MQRPLLILAAVACLAGCGGASDNATRNRTFYDWSSAGPGNTTAQFEQRYPPLDLAEKLPNPEYIGVAIVRGGVRLSRPREWMIREASNEPARAYIQYTSPNAYSFGIYERPDSPDDLWRDILNRFEDDVASVGAKVVGKRVPVATWRGQGRAYSIERKVEAAKRPLISRSREVVVRGEHRVVLVQIVHDGEDLSGIDAELARVVGTLEVL